MKNSQRILDSIGKLSDGMIESAVSYENPENKRRKIEVSPARPMKKLAVSVIAAVLCVALAVTCFANADLIKSLFQREQELIDPHAVMVDKQDESGGYTLTVEKIFSDEDLIYVYYKLHSPEPFETGYLTYENLEFGIEYVESNKVTGISPRAYTFTPGHPNPKKALVSGAYITEVKEPTCDIEGVLELGKIFMGDYVTTDTGRKVVHKEFIDWESGKYHLAITGLAVTRFIPDENGYIDENSGVESFDCVKKLDVAFYLNVNDLEELPSTYSYPDSEFTVDGYPFKITEIKQNAKNLWVMIESTSDKRIEIEDQHFNPLMMFMGYAFSDEFNMYDEHTIEEEEKFREIFPRNKLWERNYNFGIKLTNPDELFPNGRYESRYQFKDGGYDKDTVRLRFIFDNPVYPEDIEGIYVYNDELYYPFNVRPENEPERFELYIWENK